MLSKTDLLEVLLVFYTNRILLFLIPDHFKNLTLKGFYRWLLRIIWSLNQRVLQRGYLTSLMCNTSFGYKTLLIVHAELSVILYIWIVFWNVYLSFCRAQVKSMCKRILLQWIINICKCQILFAFWIIIIIIKFSVHSSLTAESIQQSKQGKPRKYIA